MPNLPLIAGTLPYFCYPSNPQTLINDAFALGVAIQATTLTGVILQDATPNATDNDKVWIRTVGGAPVTPNPWVHYNGQWVAKHPVPSSTLWALAYTGTVASIATLDGGTSAAISDNTGPFWELVTSLAAKFPIGAGTLASGTILNVGDIGGEEKHTLTAFEENPHTHKLTGLGKGNADGNDTGADQGVVFSSVGLAGAIANTTDSALGNNGVADPHNNMPPFIVLSFLRRTARIFCTQPMA